MKTRLLAILLLAGIFFCTDAYSTHYMGGEITWECLPNGRYRFTLKVYRECYTQNGSQAANFGNTVNIYASGGGHSTILMTRLPGYPRDLSPQCNSNPGFTRLLCPGMSNGAANMGALQEHVYTSDAAFPMGVLLTGVPTPGVGWTFAFGNSLTDGTCCRNPSTNIINSVSMTWWLQAKMYRYDNQNVLPCFDSSPQFAEVPVSVICSGFPFKYHHDAIDRDKDSLSYEWAQPMSSSSQPIIQYAPGYSFNNPLPGIMHNYNNVGASIDPQTGDISFTSNTNGAFFASVKVTAYKHGAKVAEIWRDFQIIVLACANNNPPIVPAPFINPANGLYELYETTVYAGDFVSFNISATDFEFLPNMQPQSVKIEAMGRQFGNNFTSTTICLQPPCATLNPPLPLTAPVAVQSTFNWQTHCNHLSALISCCVPTNVYDFYIRATDDFCPVPAQKLQRIRITVIDRPPLPPPRISCLKVLPGGDVELSWVPVIDTLAMFNCYLLYTSSNPKGPFILQDSIFSNTGSYTHHGANAESSAVYYYIKTLSGCKGDLQGISSDTLSAMHLTLSHQGASSGLAVLNWNSVNSKASQSSGGLYYIYREYPAGVWTLIDSTLALTYIDSAVLCNHFLNYRVEVLDTIGFGNSNSLFKCYSNSNVVGDVFSDIVPPNLTVLKSLSVFQVNQGVSLNWNRNSSDDTEAYVVYRYHLGNIAPVDTIFGIDSVKYVDINNNPCIGSPAYTLAAIDSCGNKSAYGNSIVVYKIQAVYDDVNDVITVSWQPPVGQLPDVYEYILYQSINYGNWDVNLSINHPGTGYSENSPNNNSVYCYYISARNQDSSVVINSCPECIIKGVYTGGHSVAETGGIRVFPNPAGDYLSVSGLTQPSQVYICDYSGKLLFKKEIQESNLDISSLSSGFYIMRIISGEESYFFSFVKQ